VKRGFKRADARGECAVVGARGEMLAIERVGETEFKLLHAVLRTSGRRKSAEPICRIDRAH